MALLLSAGCSGPKASVPIETTTITSSMDQPYSRVDIPLEDLEEGLDRIFRQISKKFGPVDYEPLIKDYLPQIRQGLHRSGYCGIRKLNINGKTVDIDIYFDTLQEPALLHIKVYEGGQTASAISLVKNYYITSE